MEERRIFKYDEKLMLNVNKNDVDNITYNPDKTLKS